MLFTVSTVSVYRRLAKFAIGMLALASMLFMTACCYIFGTCDPPPKIPLPTITLNPNSATVQVAGTFSFTAKSTDRGTSTDITTSATWSSSDTTVAKVSQGVVTGIAPGMVTITASADFADRGTASGTATLKVTAAPVLSITTTSLPNGMVNTAYTTTTLQATGGTTPYTWSLSAGTLPSGLSLSQGGTLSGTPTASGSSTFVVQVTDSSNPAQTATQQFTIAIAVQAAQEVIFASGTLVALDTNGGIAVVGNGTTGLATVFQKDSQGNWSQAVQLSNTDKSLASVAISGDGSTIVVGSCSNASCKGHAFVYVANNNAGNLPDWTQTLKTTATLSASNAQTNGGDRVGFSVATDGSGDTVVVGAPCDFTAAILKCGTVYVYERAANGWASNTETAQLIVTGTPTVSLSLSMDAVGQTIVAGSPGTEAGNNTAGVVFVFVKPGADWQTTSSANATLTEPSPTNGDFMGWSAAISADGHTVVGGAYSFAGCSPQPCHSGAAFVFVNSGAPSTWASKPADATLLAKNGFDKEAAGRTTSISAHGDTIVAGAPGLGIVTAGKAYIFERPQNGWTGTQNETSALTASGGTAIGGQSVTPSEAFGIGLSISPDRATIAVGGLATVGTAPSQGVIYVLQ